jgi:hypothetical protein
MSLSSDHASSEEVSGDSVRADGDRVKTDGPVGLGGWLVLPLLGLLLTPVVVAVQSAQYLDIGEAWPFLSNGQAIFIVAEIAMNLVLSLAAPIVLLVLAFKHSEMFPGLYMIWAAAMPIVLILDSVLGYVIFREVFEANGEGMFDKETWRSIVRSIWSAAIWIPYMMYSRRVENTFTK